MLLKRPGRLLYVVLALSLLPVFPAVGQTHNRILGEIDDTQTVTLKGNISPKAKPAYDKGPVEGEYKLTYITLALKPSAKQQAAINELLKEQQDPASPNFRKWLTPDQYADRFAVTQSDIEKIQNWLQAKGFTVGHVPRSRNWLAFSGSAAQVQNAFHTEIHRYNVDGEMHVANKSAPQIPKALAGIVAGLQGLDDFRPKSHPMVKPMSPTSSLVPVNPDWSSAGFVGNFLAPGDIATIYDLAPLYNSGIDGTGQNIAIVGQSDINLSDITQYRSAFGLSAATPTVVLIPGSTDPGFTTAQTEADLDLELVGAVARNANITYYNATNALNAMQYAISLGSAIAPVISVSFGLCESGGPGNIQIFEPSLQQASVQGTTVMVSSGDSGAAACDPAFSQSNTLAQGGETVSYPASSPEVTAVGGTEFNEGSGNYWGTVGSFGGSALSYIPEMSWNDTSNTNGLAASGGGPSTCGVINTSGQCAGPFPKPTWQVGPGVPADGARDVPDVAMDASPYHDPYIICSQNACVNGVSQGFFAAGGTSAASPVFAGIVSLLNQYLTTNKVIGQPGLGNINPTLYQLAAGVSSPFHDITTGNNIVPCLQNTPNCSTTSNGSFGFSAATGYDEVTGLGTVDGNKLITTWAGGGAATATTISLTTSAAQIGAGNSVTFTATVVASAGTAVPTGTVTFLNGSNSLGTGTLNASGVATLTTATLVAGTYAVTASYQGNLSFTGSTSSAVNLSVVDFKVAAAGAISASAGQSGNTTLTITSLATGFSPSVTLSCSGAPSEATCSLSPATVTANGAGVTSTLTVTTTAPHAQIKHIANVESPKGPLYALLIPGLFGVVGLVSNRKRGLSRLRAIGLIMVLAVSTLWLTSCGGGSNTPSDPGTPAGTYTITVTATTSSPAITHSQAVILTVN